MNPPFSSRHRFQLAFAAIFACSSAVCQATTQPAAKPNTSSIPGYEVVALGRGHLNRLCLAATVEGVKGLMMLDTGANTSGLSSGKYGFLLKADTHPLPTGVPRFGRVNGTRTPIGFTHDFKVGKSDFGSLVCPVLPARELFDRTRADQQYDGLLGEDLLRRFHAVVDCGRLVAYFNVNPAHMLHLRSGLVQAGWTRVPMTNLANDFVVPCTINGHQFRMIVDTGAPFVIMDRMMLSGAQVASRDIPLVGGVIGSHGERMGFVRLDTVAFGDFRVSGIQVVADPSSARYFQDRAHDASNGKVLGLLGGSFLAKYHAIVDVGDSALYLKADGAAR